MASPPKRKVVDIRREIYFTDRRRWQFWRPKAYWLFIIRYADGSGRIYKVKMEDG